ncbi:MAG: tetratricopeptide repeat protein [Phycisphaerales bacterium]
MSSTIARRAARRGVARVLIAVGAMGAFGAWTPVAWSRIESPREVEAAATPTLVEVTSDALAIVALMDLRAMQRPSADDYAAAYFMLEEALRLRPGDVSLARRAAEAAYNWGEAASLDRATRRVIELDPADSVAKLRLLSSTFARLQTADERIAAYDRVLGAAGASLDPAIRSRLALDAALLKREQGDEGGFGKLLAQAIRLDSTNKDAALLALTVYEQRVDARSGRWDLLSNLLYADPLDPNTHRRLAIEFARAGAWGAAKRFHSNELDLRSLAAERLSRESSVEAYVLRWLTSTPEEVYDALDLEVSKQRAEVARVRKAREEALLPTDNLPAEDDIRLSIEYEPIRIACAMAMGDADRLARAMADLKATVDTNAINLLDPLKRPEGMSEEDVKGTIRRSWATLTCWRAITGIDAEAIEADLPKAIEGLESADPEAQALRALAVARSGSSPANADDLGDSVWIAWSRAISGERASDTATRVRGLRGAWSASPLSPAGAIASLKARALMESSGIAWKDAEAADAFAEGIPAWVDLMIREPKTFETLSVQVMPTSAGALDRAMAKVKLRNISRIPLGLGVGKPINSRVMFAPSFSAGPDVFISLVFPEVLDCAHRLRLNPGESLEAEFPLEIGPTAWVSQTASGVATRTRWRVLQGFVDLPGGGRDKGPGCVETQTESIVRGAIPEARQTPAELVERVKTAASRDLPTLLTAVRAVFAMREGITTEAGGLETLAGALATAYPTWDVASRRWAIAALPPSGEIPSLKAFDDAVLNEAEVSLLGLVIVTRAASADLPIFERASASGDADLRLLVEIQRRRLADGGRPYAVRGTGLAGGVGAAIRFRDLGVVLRPQGVPAATGAGTPTGP